MDTESAPSPAEIHSPASRSPSPTRRVSGEVVSAIADTPINILIVDDEPKNLTVLETVLDDPRYRLVRAESADQALLALVVEEFALLILDIHMPNMSGFELAQVIKARKKTARVPIIFLTAYYNEEQHVLEGYGAGAVDYMLKPVNAVMLRSKVEVFAELHRTGRDLAWANRSLLAEVTDRCRAEEQLRRLNATLDQRVTEGTQALHASNARLRLVTDAVGLGVWTWRPEADQIVWENGWTYRMFGVLRRDVPVTMARFGAEFIHPDDLARFEQALADVHTGAGLSFEGRLLRPDGALRWIELTGRAVTERDGAAPQILGIMRDITERRLAEQSLRESEARYRSLFNSIDEGFCVVEMLFDEAGNPSDFRCLEVNPAFEKHCGLKGATGKRIRELLPDLEAHWIETFGKVAVSGEAARTTGEVKTLNRWLDVYAFPLGGQGSRTVAVVFSDISERRHAEQVLRERERLLSTVTAAAKIGLAVVEPGYAYRFANDAYAQILGLAVNSIVGQPVCDVLADGWSEAQQRLDQAFAGERVRFELTLPAIREGGFPRHYAASYEPQVDQHGQRIVVVVAVEITDLKRFEAQLRDSDRRKDVFLGTLAHELRNPLAAVRNAMHLLQKSGPATPELQWAPGVIDRQVRAMVRLIDDLMDVSRVNQGKFELRREWVELAQVLHDAVETSRPLIDECGHELTLTLPSEPISLDADPTRLAQVVMNLLNNAAKYTDRGGHIELSARREGGAVVVAVKDSGIGIAADKLASVFEPFSQVDGTLSRSRGGLGIGLALVRQMVEMHGGAVEACSDGPGLGSEFVVRLPLPTDAGQRVPTADTAAAPTTPSAPPLRILVVDDNRDAAATLAALLTRIGHDVQTAHDGGEAVQAAGRFIPQVVLLDIGLPKMSGFEACRRIKEQPWGKAMTLIALSGWGDQGAQRIAREVGFERHMIKPVDPSLLLEAIAELRNVAA